MLATNTSALSVTRVAAASAHPDRVVGLHFFNPAPVMPLVEVVRTELTSEDAFATAFAFVERIGKTPIACRDTPGLRRQPDPDPVLNDAVRVLDEGGGERGGRRPCAVPRHDWPIGPLALMDLIGVDVHVHAAEALWEAYREPRFAPPPRLARMQEAGQLGRKTGRGFFRYDA